MWSRAGGEALPLQPCYGKECYCGEIRVLILHTHWRGPEGCARGVVIKVEQLLQQNQITTHAMTACASLSLALSGIRKANLSF